MGKITVWNRRDFGMGRTATYVGRGSVLGNPFVLRKHGNREEVIEKFRQLLWTDVQNKGALYDAIDSMAQRLNYEDINLVCYCAPKACHADIIKNAVMWINSEKYGPS